MEKAWTHSVTVADIPDDGSYIELETDAETRAAVAKLAGLRDLPRLSANFDLSRRGEAIAVRGEVTGRVGQTCVVTLEPMESDVHEQIDLVFAPPVEGEADGEDSPRRKRKGEPPEPLDNDVIDLGAIATEFLILGIDPYPRKEGAELAKPAAAEGGDKPFAALAKLKKPR
jgi:uncharacterized metal-binding protein YceD (DUF177 family)